MRPASAAAAAAASSDMRPHFAVNADANLITVGPDY